MLAFVGVLVAGMVAIVVAVALRGRAGSKAATPAPVAAPVPRAAPLAAESVPRQPVLQRDGPSQAARTVPAGPAPASGGVRRYARTWVNVRQDRSNGAPAVRVLNPGEAVMVDSLKRGWYRVRANDRTVGYVYRTQLDAAPPAARF